LVRSSTIKVFDLIADTVITQANQARKAGLILPPPPISRSWPSRACRRRNMVQAQALKGFPNAPLETFPGEATCPRVLQICRFFSLRYAYQDSFCLALGFAVGFVLNSHWVRHQQENALQMRQAGFERDLGQVLISGFQTRRAVGSSAALQTRTAQTAANCAEAGDRDRKTLEKILLSGHRNEDYWKKVFSTIGDIAEERKKER